MNEKTWLDYLTAIGAVATPLLVLVLTGVGWRLRHKIERRLQLEDKLREDRISIYQEILEPFILLLISEEAWKSDPKNKNKDRTQLAVQLMLSTEYRRLGFRLSLVGADPVVRAYNDLMQFFFQRPELQDTPSLIDIKEMMALLGAFLLEIRRSAGNEHTALDNWEMMEWFLKDARRYRHGHA